MEIDIEHISKIARLKLSEEEKQKFSKDLREILDAFEIIKQIDTSNIKPTFKPIEIKNITRKDVVKESLALEEVFQNTKNKEDKYFKGPKIM